MRLEGDWSLLNETASIGNEEAGGACRACDAEVVQTLQRLPPPPRTGTLGGSTKCVTDFLGESLAILRKQTVVVVATEQKDH